MYAIIDIGSNTIRLNIYKLEDGKISLLLSKKEMTGLASYIHHGRMSQTGIDCAAVVLADFYRLTENLHIETYAFATAALRNISNSNEAVREIAARSGLTIQILPGEREAELDFCGATRDTGLDNGLLVDIGGASTELVIFKEAKISQALSFPIGSLNMYNKYVHNLLPNRSERKAIQKEVIECLTHEDTLHSQYQRIGHICGVGGTLRAAAKLNNALFELPAANKTINAPNVKKIIKLLENDDDDDLIAVDTLDVLLHSIPERVRTILPGMIILYALVKFFGITTIHVSETGIREGYLIELLDQDGKTAALVNSPAMPAAKATAPGSPATASIDKIQPLAAAAKARPATKASRPAAPKKPAAPPSQPPANESRAPHA